MDVGDVSWHAGWTLHCAEAQPLGSRSRLALSVSYIKDGTRLLPRRYAGRLQSEDKESYAEWVADLKDGAVARHSMLPMVTL